MSPGYLSIGINIYERAGLLKAALALVEKALAVHDVLANRLAWVQLLVRVGRQEAIVEWLGTVTDDIDGSPSELMTLARIIDRYVGHDRRSLEIGYRALRAGYGRPELHLGYAIGLVITGRPDDNLLAAPETIEVGSGAELVNETTGEIIFRIIEPEGVPVIERGEIGPDDAFARRLIGLRVGDTIEVVKAAAGAQEYRVGEVQSRHLFAMRRTLRDFPSLFPDNPAFGSFDIDDATIYGWTRMGIAKLVEKTGIRLAVVQSTIDALRQLAEERADQRGRKMGTLGFDGERYRLVELTDEVVDRQVASATEALQLAERLTLLPAEGERPIPDRVADLVKDLEPAYADTLLAALQDKRALLTDDLGFRVVAQEAGAACTWTQPFAQAGHGPAGISHPEYRTIVAALIDANLRFTQFGHAEVLGELLETGWAVNDRLRTWAALITSDSLDRGSISTLLAQLLIDSKLHAPGDTAFAAFHVALAEAGVASGRADVVRGDYERALAAVEATITRNANRLLLPKLLRETTHMTPVRQLTREHRQIARRQTRRIRDSLDAGGLWRYWEAAGNDDRPRRVPLRLGSPVGHGQTLQGRHLPLPRLPQAPRRALPRDRDLPAGRRDGRRRDPGNKEAGTSARPAALRCSPDTRTRSRCTSARWTSPTDSSRPTRTGRSGAKPGCRPFRSAVTTNGTGKAKVARSPDPCFNC